MSEETKNIFLKNRIDFALDALNLSAAALSRASGVDASIINKWRKGSRALTGRSVAVREVAAALLSLDERGALREHYAPYNGCDDMASLVLWLTGTPLPALVGQVQAPAAKVSGEYVVEHAVYLGKKGFRKAVLSMMDYLLVLPPGQTVTVLCQGKWEWFIQNLPFVLIFIAKLKKAVHRGARLRMINRKGYSLADSSKFAGYWLTAHLNGYIRSLYYDGGLPRDIRFVGSIPGFWSGRAEEDNGVEDSLYVGLYTEARETRKDAALCDEYAAISRTSSQYAFFQNPLGNAENEKLWHEGPLPRWTDPGARAPEGSFFALTRVPGIGIATWDEFQAVAGKDAPPALPRYIFREHAAFAPGPHKIILCREDVRDGLSKERRMHEVMGEILNRRAFVSRSVLAAQVRRLLKAMAEKPDFEVALVPRVAFEKLNLELVCFRDSVTIGWLNNMKESVLTLDEATAGSIYGYVGIVWDRLHQSWKRQTGVRAMLNKWIVGQALTEPLKDSAAVRNWDVEPRED